MAGVKLSVAVQHHPARAHLLPVLQERLAGLRVEVVTDPEPDAELPSPLRTYTLAAETTPAWATHRLILQDDTQPCRGFAGKLLAAIGEKPDAMVALFTPGIAPHKSAIIKAQLAEETWARLHCLWMPTVAMVWPAAVAREFAVFAREELGTARRGEPFRGDDGPVGTFCQQYRYDVWATVPSLVEHPDVERSLIGRPNAAGANRGRVAAAFVD